MPRYNVHELKVTACFYSPLADGSKKFEIRKNDRNFKVDDILVLRAWNPIKKEYLDVKPVIKRITYLTSFPMGLKSGHVCMSLEDF